MSRHKIVVDTIGRARVYYLAKEGQWVVNSWDPVLSVIGNNCTDTVLFDVPSKYADCAMYVKISSGCNGKSSVNRISLEKTDEGFEWEIVDGQIAYPGPIKLQVEAKRFDDDLGDAIWQSSVVSAMVGSSIDTSCLVEGQDPKYLEELDRRIEKQADEIRRLFEQVTEVAGKPPIVGDNGNWWIYDVSSQQYVDSGIELPSFDRIRIIDGGAASGLE